MTIAELEEIYAQGAQEASEPPEDEKTDEPTEDQLEAAQLVMEVHGIVTAAANKTIDPDTAMPVCHFGMSMDQPIEDFGEITVEVRGTGLVEFAEIRFRIGATVVAEGIVSVVGDGDSEWLVMEASMIGIIAEV